MKTSSRSKLFQSLRAGHDVVVAAQLYVALRLAVVPAESRSKKCLLPGWEKLRILSDQVLDFFKGDHNIALLNGEPSGNVVDVDVDSEHARRLVLAEPGVLPPTPFIWGRDGAPASHRLYVAEPLPASAAVKFSDPAGASIIEIRASASLSLVPPSIHPSGERYRFDEIGEPAKVDFAHLHARVSWVAAAALVAARWPQRGTRHEAALALAGALLRRGMKTEDVTEFVRHVAVAAGDEEAEKRTEVVTSTATKIVEGEPVAGAPRFAEIVDGGKKILARIAKWLGIGGGGDRQESNTRKPSSPIVDAVAAAEKFHAPDGTAYISLNVNDRPEVLRVKGAEFRQFLRLHFYRTTGDVLGSQDLKESIEVIEAQARYDGPTLPVHVRVAEDEAGAAYLDLADAERRVVRITPDGWSVDVTNPAVRFYRAPGMLALPLPERGGRIESLQELIPSEEAGWRLTAGWLLAALNPRGPYPVLVLTGPQGSTKSVRSRLLRGLVDPNVAALRSLPRDERDLVISARNAHIIALDNISELRPWLSDAICRISTGGGFATRALYTDATEAIFDSRRPLILNGIEEFCVRGDLRDRSLVVDLQAMPDSARRQEREVQSEYEARRPGLIGVLLDGVASGLRDRATIQLPKPPRLADAAVWITAAEPGAGLGRGGFIEAYGRLRAEANAVAVEASPVALAIVRLIDEAFEWNGTATELLEVLNSQTSLEVQKQRTWPKGAQPLSNAIRRVLPDLTGAGVRVTFLPSKERRLIVIEKAPVAPSASPSSPSSEEARKHASTGGGSTGPEDASGDEASDASDGEAPFASRRNASAGRDDDAGDESDEETAESLAVVVDEEDE